ncbi:MAG: hypothetical protein NZ580_01895 [Bacteroidia bacterium]|nr:hypothetical protein [Bacteroidia bacterium]MDW8235968.1 hypothetical protein [Bacteroidia bacterium]
MKESPLILEEFLVPTSELEVKVILERLQSHACLLLNALGSLLYVADPIHAHKFHYEAGSGLTQAPSPSTFEEGESLLGEAVQSKRVLSLTLPSHKLHEPALSAMLEVPQIQFFAIPLIYQGRAEGLWVVASSNAHISESLQQPDWKEFLFKWAAYLQSLRARRYIESLLEQSQVQNQELISREEELRQNLEELAVTQEEMRRTQQLLSKQAQYQHFLIDLFVIIAGANAFRFSSISKVFLGQIGQFMGAKVLAMFKAEPVQWRNVASWKPKKIADDLPRSWTPPPTLQETLEKNRVCVSASASEIHLEGYVPFWIVAPYFVPKGLGGVMLLGYDEPKPIDREEQNLLLHASIGFFASLEQVEHTHATIRNILQDIAEKAHFRIQTMELDGNKGGDIPWLDEIPLVQRNLYREAFSYALAERQHVWHPPQEIASNELCLFLYPHCLRLSWNGRKS